MEILFILVIITFDELPGWLYLQSVLYLYWGQTQVKVWNSAPPVNLQLGLCGFIRVSACWPGSRLTFKLGLLGFKRLSDHSCFSCLSTLCSSQHSPLTANTDFWFTCGGTGFGGQTPDFNLSDIVSASTCSRRTISESQGQELRPPWLDLDTFHLNHFELCWGFRARCEERAEHWVISWC